MEGPRCIRCRRCSPDQINLDFYCPDQVYCLSCEQRVGETATSVTIERATINPAYGVVDPDTGEEYAPVEWDRDRVAIL